MRNLWVLRVSCFAAALLLSASAAHGVTIDWVTVGDPGNACDTQSQGCFGSVNYVYRISKYEVTNAQYTEFLNAVAADDTYGLYNPDYMGSDRGGITRSGSPGSYTYSTIAGREEWSVNWVSFYDSLRFANWLHNGQPTGAQGNATTEDGAYTLSGAMSVGSRNAGATIFLTSEDEWYKAAYFNGTSYFDYPAGSDTQTRCDIPSRDTGNSANCNQSMGGRPTDVGAYSLSVSPNGTFDQGGNVWEWNEAIIGSRRGIRGGGGGDIGGNLLAASIRLDVPPTIESGNYGFRVAMIPEPSTALLLGIGLAGLAVRRRRLH